LPIPVLLIMFFRNVTPVFGKVFFGKLFMTSVNTGEKFFYYIEHFITMTIYIIILLVVYKC